MSTEIVKEGVKLPATLEDLSKFVVVGREKLVSVRAEIRAMDRLGLLKGIREQKLEEGQMLGDAVLDAETRMGELLRDNVLSSPRDEEIKVGRPKTLPEGISWNQSSQFQKMAAHKDVVERVKAEARERDDLPTRKAVLQAIKRPHVSYNSGINEWYTPVEYIESARNVLGDIDLDPASSELANTVVKAKKIYTIEDNGLIQEWMGRIWLNPPYAADLVGLFIEKLNVEVSLHNVESAIVLVNNATETHWFRVLVNVSSCICFPTGRVKFWNEDGNTGAPLQGQAIVYIGDEYEAFHEWFERFGWIATL
jgi:hypothetical protein